MSPNVLWRAAALAVALAFMQPSSSTAAQAHWHVIRIDAPGPYVDAVIPPDGTLWVSSVSVQGFIRIDARGRTKVFRTPGFTPAYLTMGQDGRVYATDVHRKHVVGAITLDGQLTVYVQPARVDRISTSKIVALEKYDLTYVGSSGQLVTIWEGSANGVAYPSGITNNHDIAMSAVGFAIRFTECCQPTGGGALGNYTPFNPIVEYPLPYKECWSPAGIAFDYTLVYVPCAGGRDALLVSVDERSGRTAAIPFPGRYLSRVNSVVFGTDGNLYFATGAGPRLVRYDTVGKSFATVATPDGSIPTAITTAVYASSNRLFVITNANRKILEYDVP